MKYETVTLIDGNELNALIRDTYDRRYSVGRMQELGQDSMIRVRVPGEDMLCIDEFEISDWLALELPEDLKGWRKQSWYEQQGEPHIQIIMNDLHARGLIPEGDYVIRIWW